MEQQANSQQAAMDFQIKQQNDLLACYKLLADKGVLRGFGVASTLDALPAPEPRVMLPDDQQRLTGLPTSAFAPPRGNDGSLVAGALSAAALFGLSELLEVDFRVLGAAFAAVLLADRILLRGSAFEIVARTLQPKYRTTVVQHEAGHFLVACTRHARPERPFPHSPWFQQDWTALDNVPPFALSFATDLLGMPLQACLLNPWAALQDGRFAGAAGTVFFDPALGDGMAKGTLRRETLDRYSVVVLAGIAAEAMVNGQAEGGRADEQALITLLASLNGGQAWDLPRIQNQARWGASQALLLLREHQAPYQALCAALERGCTIGEAIVALEMSITETFGRNGELPAETRLRKAREARLAMEAAAAVSSSQDGVARPKNPAPDQDALKQERASVAAKLEEVQRQLEALDEKAVD